jgi:hypothetical protein
MNVSKKNAYRTGLTVLLILAVLTVIEFALASFSLNWAWLLFLVAILKAWFVVQQYMHLPRLFSGEEGN